MARSTLSYVAVKKCTKCKKTKPLNKFNKCEKNEDGLTRWCKGCVSKYDKEYYRQNKGKKAEYRKKYSQRPEVKARKAKYEQRPEVKAKRAKYNKKYGAEHRLQRNSRQRERKRTDIRFNLNGRMAESIWSALRENKKGRKWESLAGYTVIDLKKSLQKTMPTGYSWDDYLDGKLHIDHIIPKSAFNYTKPEHEDFKRCWALDNLQLLPALENLIKYNKIDGAFQPSLQIVGGGI